MCDRKKTLKESLQSYLCINDVEMRQEHSKKLSQDGKIIFFRAQTSRAHILFLESLMWKLFDALAEIIKNSSSTSSQRSSRSSATVLKILIFTNLFISFLLASICIFLAAKRAISYFTSF